MCFDINIKATFQEEFNGANRFAIEKNPSIQLDWIRKQF